ncbi:MAG: hypothetical protein R3B90_17305 [Planctomycetaceae bacterium]
MSPPSTTRHRFLWSAAAPSLAVSAVLMAVAICAAAVLWINRRQTEGVLDQAVGEIQRWEKLQSDLEEVQSALRAWDDSEHQHDLDYMDPRDLLLYQELERIAATHELTFNRDFLDLAKETLRRRSRERLTSHPAPKDPLTSEVQAALDELLDPGLIARTEHAWHSAWQKVDEAREESRQLSIRTTWVLVLLGCCGSTAGVLAGLGLARGLHRKFLELSIPVRTATGTLNEVIGPVELGSSGEVPQLQETLDAMASRVTTVVSRLQDAERQSLRQDQLAALGQLAADWRMNSATH